MITCAEAVEQFWAYLENEVTKETRDQLEEHLTFCRRCCGEVEFAEELRNFLTSAARPALPDDVERRLESFVAGLESDR